MKKRKNEIILIIIVVIIGLLSFYFYKQSKNIKIEEEIKYTEKGGVDYKVYLSDKKYYNKEFLGEGMQYISSIIDYVDLNYNYSNTFDIKDTFNITKRVDADLKIVDPDDSDKVIYQKKESLKQETTTSDSVNVTDKIKLDYQKYNKLANEFKSSYGISAKSNLVVTYTIDYSGKNSNIRQSKAITVEVPLSEQMINITKSNAIYNNSSYIVESSQSLANKVMFILSILFIVLDVILVGLLIHMISMRIKSESKYDRFIAKILRDNDSYITIAKDEYVSKDKSVVKIDSFKELMDVRNNIDKPIIYTKVDHNTSKFVIADNEVYEYTVTREEMDY